MAKLTGSKFEVRSWTVGIDPSLSFSECCFLLALVEKAVHSKTVCARMLSFPMVVGTFPSKVNVSQWVFTSSDGGRMMLALSANNRTICMFCLYLASLCYRSLLYLFTAPFIYCRVIRLSDLSAAAFIT